MARGRLSIFCRTHLGASMNSGLVLLSCFLCFTVGVVFGRYFSRAANLFRGHKPMYFRRGVHGLPVVNISSSPRIRKIRRNLRRKTSLVKLADRRNDLESIVFAAGRRS